jgi:hypothetical protein
MENTDESTPAYNAGNPRHVERREKTAKTTRRQRNEDFRWLMGDARGRRFIWDLLAKAGVFRSSMGLSAELTAFNEGRRDLGLAVLADLMRLCPEQYGRMQAEAISKQPASNGENDGGRDDSNS